jgi:Kef-type K+ transport system membrane component KefB
LTLPAAFVERGGMTPQALAIAMLLQFAVILAACKLVGWLARKIGQPQVVGEMIAGILLGPSVLGYFFPESQAALFPEATKGVLFANATLGLSLYMFLVGVEFNPTLLRGRKKTALAISVAGMLAPFAAGALLAPPMLKSGGYFTEGVSPGGAVLYLGACMAITAFPMLARIIHERRLAGTPMGVLTLGAGAVDDACAWVVLAVVLAMVNKAAGGMMTPCMVRSDTWRWRCSPDGR